MQTLSPMIYKFTGAGNNFVVLDGRQGGMEEFRSADRIRSLCREYGTDGLMILGLAEGNGTIAADFSMEFYNPDGSGGMMCGNGGRCIVAFADYLGLVPASADGTWHFLAPDGMHSAVILDKTPGRWTVRLRMIDVTSVESISGGYFLNTGTRHFVKFVPSVDTIDIEAVAKPIRWAPEFAPEGVNVNFVEVSPDGLRVRTFEKGVEGETLACGTGLTASAIAAFVRGIPSQAGLTPDVAGYRLQCRRGDWLQVEFSASGQTFTSVHLTGPAEII